MHGDATEGHKNPEQVLAEFLSAESPEDWLVEEVCDFLFDAVPDGEIDERLNSFDQLMAAERERMLDGGPELDDVVLYTITVEHDDEGGDDGEEEFLSFRGCPSPALLLEACTHMASPGELVRVDMVYGDASHSSATLLWPFPMHVAVEVTTAMRRELDETGIAFLEFVQAHAFEEAQHGSGDDVPEGAPQVEVPVPTRAGGGPTGPAAPDKVDPGRRPTATGGLVLGAAVGTAVGVLVGLAAARRFVAALGRQ